SVHSFSFYSAAALRALPSFPTRRSSDLVDDFVADKLGVVAADFAVVEIVILAAIFDERSQRRREFFGLVFGDEVHNVIGDQSRRSEEHTSELQSPYDLVCRLLLEKKKKK